LEERDIVAYIRFLLFEIKDITKLVIVIPFIIWATSNNEGDF